MMTSSFSKKTAARVGLLALALAWGVAAVASSLWTERVFHKSMNGSSQTLVSENSSRHGMCVMAITTAGAANTGVIVFTTSTSAHVTQTARSGANLNGTPLPGGASYCWPIEDPTVGVYKGAVTVIGGGPDGAQAREW